jgi:hypothetical protein
VYTVGLEGSNIVLSDTHNGRPQLVLAAQNTNGTVIGPVRPLAIDPTGTKIVLALVNGLSYFELNTVPLAVGTVTSSGSPGGTIQLRGSGFVAGTTATVGGQNATCNFVTSETLSCTIPPLAAGTTWIKLANPDGQTYSLENAFRVQ